MLRDDHLRDISPFTEEEGVDGGQRERARERDRVVEPTVRKWFLCFGVTIGDRSTHCQSGEKSGDNNE